MNVKTYFKLNVYFLLLILLTPIFFSCSTNNKIAPNIEGNWDMSPDELKNILQKASLNSKIDIDQNTLKITTYLKNNELIIYNFENNKLLFIIQIQPNLISTSETDFLKIVELNENKIISHLKGKTKLLMKESKNLELKMQTVNLFINQNKKYIQLKATWFTDKKEAHVTTQYFNPNNSIGSSTWKHLVEHDASYKNK